MINIVIFSSVHSLFSLGRYVVRTLGVLALLWQLFPEGELLHEN